jgi:probable F420-dependent oxidoreductase
VKFGLMMGLGVGEGCAYPEYLAPAVVRAEEAGFESVWAGEHVVMPDYEPNYPYTEDGRLPQPHETDVADPLVWLTYAAALTSTIRLATGVVVLPLRNPVVLAKQVASLDLLSGGRAMLGIGVGWMREEADAVGVPFAGRGRRAEEYVGAMRALWSADVSSFDGEHVRFAGVRCFPKPVQKDRRVPVIIGGSGPAAARRAGRIGDGYYPIAPTVEELARQIGLMRSAAREAGRDPAEVEVSTMAFSLVGPDPVTRAQLDDFHRMADLGVSRVVVPRLLDSAAATVLASIDRLGDQLIGAYQ